MSTQRRPQEWPDPSPFHVGDRVRKARETAGMEKGEFAAATGIHRETITRYETTGKVKRSALISISWATPVALEWLEHGTGPFLKSDGPESAPQSGEGVTSM